MNILIIENDEIISNNIRKVFERKTTSNRIKILSSYKQFLGELNIIKSYDIILVDILLGEKTKNGLDIVRIIRAEDKSIPIIIISGLNDIAWIKQGFEVGASDYIMKPFRLKELEIRVYKWFKIYFYSDKSNNKEINYFGLKYNLKENSFYFNDKNIEITKGNKYLLSIFLTNREIILPENLLVEKIWGDIGFIIERNLRVKIARLRDGLKNYNIANWIQNIRGEGYILKKS